MVAGNLKEKAVETYIDARHSNALGFFLVTDCFEQAMDTGELLDFKGLLLLVEDLVLNAARLGMTKLNVFFDDVDVAVGQMGDDFKLNRYTVFIEGTFRCEHSDVGIKTGRIKISPNRFNSTGRVYETGFWGSDFITMLNKATGFYIQGSLEAEASSLRLELSWLSEAEKEEIDKMLSLPLGYEAYKEGVPIEDILA